MVYPKSQTETSLFFLFKDIKKTAIPLRGSRRVFSISLSLSRYRFKKAPWCFLRNKIYSAVDCNQYHLGKL